MLLLHKICGSSSVGRAWASQAQGRGFEPRLPLLLRISHTYVHYICTRVKLRNNTSNPMPTMAVGIFYTTSLSNTSTLWQGSDA